MNVQEKPLRGYMVSVAMSEDVPEQLLLRFMPRGLEHERGAGGKPARAPEYVARVLPDADRIQVVWDNPPPPKVAAELKAEAARRMSMRAAWIDRLTELMLLVQRWAEEMDWSTKTIAKRIEDTEIGDYQAPALLLQKELVRVLFDPIGRSVPGADGLVDLYLLPGYEDIASLYFREGKWHLHYAPPGTTIEDTRRETETKPLSKPVLRKVLDEMRKNGR